MKIKPAKPQKDSQDEKLSVKKRRKWYYTFVISMAALVGFSTTYALILPAITMEKEDEQVYRVSDWSWEDSYGALTENEGEWYLSLPGADEDNPMTEESVRELLPGKVSATMSDGTTEELALEWDLSILPEIDGYEGTYLVSAALPENYALQEDVLQLQVTLMLGDAEQYADPNYPGVRRTLTEQELTDALKTHTVQGLNPPDTTVHIFDYTSAYDGAKQKDLLKNSELAYPDDWNRGINQGHLLLFGDQMLGAGYWNIGAGAGKKWAQKYTNLKGIVKSTLENGYPVIDLEKARNPLNDVTEPKELSNLYRAESAWDAENLENAQKAPALSTTVLQGAGARGGGNTWDYTGVDASLAYLFDPKVEMSSDKRKSYENVTGLFQMDDSGYYYYNARKNFAEFVENQNGNDQTWDGKPSDGSFILYDGPAVWRSDGGWDGKGFSGDMSLGNFYPFNKGRQVFDSIETIEGGKQILSSSVTLDNSKWSKKDVKFENNATKEEVFLNHHLGVSLEIDFTQPVNGQVNMGVSGKQDMIFEFSGDDDVWIFVDDVLVLDIGGIHSELYGTINFATGEVVTGQSWRTNGKIPDNPGETPGDSITNLYELFKKALGEEEANKLNWSTKNGNTTFASSSTHTLKMFYLERGNYDSSMYLRFNLQPMLYQQIKKVDQNGNPLAGVEFELYAAKRKEGAEEGSSNINDYEQVGELLATMKTEENGTTTFFEKDENGVIHPFNFADRYSADRTVFYILKETKAPDGYRTLPEDIVLYFNPDTAMLKVVNRYQTGAYASFLSSILETGSFTYGAFSELSGNIEQSEIEVDDSSKENGLVIAVPMLLQKDMSIDTQEHTGKWITLYGSNTAGFKTVIPEERTAVAWRTAILKTLLYQCSNEELPEWYLQWNDETMRLDGTLNDLPGQADRYALNNSENPDMKMVYGVIEPYALSKLGITGETSEERYHALGAYVQEEIRKELERFDETSGKSQEEVIDEVISGICENIRKVPSDGSSYAEDGEPKQRGFSFLNTDQFERNFRSIIYIPNEQRELRVRKIDEDGKSINGATFTLYKNTGGNSTDNVAASGVTATVDGQDGVLIFMPSPPKDQNGNVLPGYAQMPWAVSDCTQFILKETKAPQGYKINETEIPVILGVYSIYADAGSKDDGITVMAGVGKLMQTMTKYAADDMVNITLRDITAIAQTQESLSVKEWSNDGWEDDKLEGTGDIDALRSMNLHYGINKVVNYGLHDEDGGKTMNPFFVTDTGFLRARIVQNGAALKGDTIYHDANVVNWDDLGDMNITSLFSQSNIVVVTNKKDTSATGKLTIRKEIAGPNLSAEDYKKNFTFTVTFWDKNGEELKDRYYYFGTDRAGYIESGKDICLSHDEAVTILGLPLGTKWRVEERENDGWDESSGRRIMIGSIKEANQTVAAKFVNEKVVFRSLEGLTWMDENMDGIQNEMESSRFSGVKVQLLRLKENGDRDKEEDYEPYYFQGDPERPVEVETGQQISVRESNTSAAITYEQGRYKFTDLPAGVFAVRFVDGTSGKISELVASPYNRGEDDTKDSDGKPVYSENGQKKLERMVILGIEMPSAEKMETTLYESKYHDSGFYTKGYELPDTGGHGKMLYYLAGLLLTAISCIGYTLGRRREKVMK